MNNIAPSAARAILIAGIVDFLMGCVLLGSRFGFLPWDFAKMFGIPGFALTMTGAILVFSGAGMIMWMLTRRNDAPLE